MKRALPIVAGAVAGGVIAAIIAISTNGTKTVTTTTVLPASRAAESTSFQGGHGLSVDQIYRLADPGVVDITTTSTQNTGVFGFGQQQQQGEGAGLVYDSKGDILTDEHVVDSATQITVTFADGRKASASIVGKDTGADVAVIHVNVPSSELHPLTLADSNNVGVGDAVVAIGSPFSLPNTITAGIVSAVGRTISAPNSFTIPDAIQTDAAINPGNSGGPLINASGQVVGLADQIDTNNQNSQGQGSNSGVGFATPSNTDRRIANQIIRTGKAQNAYVGVSLNPQVPGGAKISSTGQGVVPGGPAAKAGLQPGDLITAVNGKSVTSVNQFVATVAAYPPGATVTLTYSRGGQTKTARVTLGSQPASAPSSANQVP